MITATLQKEGKRKAKRRQREKSEREKGEEITPSRDFHLTKTGPKTYDQRKWDKAKQNETMEHPRKGCKRVARGLQNEQNRHKKVTKNGRTTTEKRQKNRSKREAKGKQLKRPRETRDHSNRPKIGLVELGPCVKGRKLYNSKNKTT
ncbi:hypothetical protein [Fervidicola ferrireducens]|uniref:hypothetical protein n=1 Tax=Fervidicola ferrireducens TaxID=520764 RepID=UPI000837095F|nr:hypothetical protein [Fervidicola ferrireducens]